MDCSAHPSAPPLPTHPAQVTCGSAVKLEADGTRHLLHSHEVSYGYGRGSGQQSVTGFPEHDSAGSLWIVRSAGVSVAGKQVAPHAACAASAGSPHARCSRAAPVGRLLQCAQGTPITNGQLVKLQHIGTRRWLHSHLFASPLSNNQEVGASGVQLRCVANRSACRPAGPHACLAPLVAEHAQVSCFGDDSTTDTGDVWRVEWDGGAPSWQRDAVVRLAHHDTGAYLSNHAKKYQRPIPGHTEVFAVKGKGGHAVWRATEGVFFPGHTEA